MAITILDGAMGTELARRGISVRGPGWSARAVIEAPDAVRSIHRAYAEAGAQVLTACTFRTTERAMGEGWEDAARAAVVLAKEAAGAGVRVAGSIAPLEDCYRPDLSPAEADPAGAAAEHGALARVLAEAGCDVILCETFPHVREAMVALGAALETGLPSWVSMSPGYAGDLLSTRDLERGAHEAADLGAGAVLVNCAPLEAMGAFVRAIAAGGAGRVSIGAYANASNGDHTVGPTQYAQAARGWVKDGATIVGGCCYTTPEHIAELARSIER